MKALYSVCLQVTTYLSHQIYIGGVEAEYLSHDTSAKYRVDSFEEEMSFENEYTASLLLGNAYSDNVNIYGRLGVSRAKAEGKTTDGDSGDDTVSGWLAGVGAEFKNTSPMSLRAEYRYSKFKEIDFDYGVSVENSTRSHSVSVSGVYSF